MDREPILQPKLIQSYVYHKDKVFFVSTARRYSSSVLKPDYVYSETIVWEWDAKTKERGQMIYQTGAGQWYIEEHQRVEKELFETGRVEDE